MELVSKLLSYDIIGLCMEVHNNLGAGFSEVLYKDALGYEFRNAEIPFKGEEIFSALQEYYSSA